MSPPLGAQPASEASPERVPVLAFAWGRCRGYWHLNGLQKIQPGECPHLGRAYGLTRGAPLLTTCQTVTSAVWSGECAAKT
jgi:hypothetical protein